MHISIDAKNQPMTLQLQKHKIYLKLIKALHIYLESLPLKKRTDLFLRNRLFWLLQT